MPRKSNAEIKAEMQAELDAKFAAFSEMLLSKLGTAQATDTADDKPARARVGGKKPPAPRTSATPLRVDIVRGDVQHADSLTNTRFASWDVVTKFAIGRDKKDRNLVRLSPLKPTGTYENGRWTPSGEYVAKADVTLTSTQLRTLAKHLITLADGLDS